MEGSSSSPSSSPLYPDNINGVPVLVTEEFLHRGPEAVTYLVRRPPGTPEDTRRFVVKLFEPVWDSRAGEEIPLDEQGIDAEADAIDIVRARCGNVTPALLGRYVSDAIDGRVLLQEYGGTRLEGHYDALPLADRESVWSLTRKLHAARILHGDLAERNFLRGSDGEIRVIDFGHCDVEHECPGEDECSELRNLMYVLFPEKRK